MMGPTGSHRVVQLHPTRRCNLRCLHCYSSSGPDEREELEPALLAQLLADAATLGYTVAGFSGGEPLMYPALTVLLDRAHDEGLVTTITTNGMLLDEARLRSLAGRVDLLAISLDGVPASHDRMRASTVAFRRMSAHLEDLRRSGIRFGFIFTLTQHNVHELDWVASFAADQGASLLQVHPLEEVGRAAATLLGSRPDEIEMAVAYLEFLRIREKFGDRMHIQLDVADREALSSSPDRVFAGAVAPTDVPEPVGRVLSPLIVETDGTVVPIQYGFPRTFALGNVHDRALPDLFARWMAERYEAFLRLCRSVYDDIGDDADSLPFLNWYELLTTRAASA